MNTYNYDEIFKDIESRHGLEVLDLIQNLPLEKQRIAMLAAICYKKDSNLVKIINELKSSSRIAYLDSLIERIRKYNGIGDIEKKSFGEVFTPFSLIEEMLDTLPVEVWTNPNLKWGDFCNGIGNFMVIVIKRLMIGLKEWENDDDLRYKHIVENMIYVGELQEKNMFLWMVSIDPRSEFKLNLFRGNALGTEFDEHMKNEWKVLKFNVLVSNPPYQEQKEGYKKSKSIWHHFVEKYISILSDTGYLSMVHPSGWRTINSEFDNTKKLLQSKKILYLEMHNKWDGEKVFNAATTYDWYVLKNEPSNNYKTKIKCQDGKIEFVDISNRQLIPNGMFKEIDNLIAKKDEEKVDIVYSRSLYGNDKKNMSKEKSNDNIYPCVYRILKGGKIVLWWSNEKKDHFDIPKIIWSEGSASVPILDIDGDYGIMNFACGLTDDVENLEKIKIALENKDFLKILSFTDGKTGVGGQKYNNKAISIFRKDFWKEFI